MKILSKCVLVAIMNYKKSARSPPTQKHHQHFPPCINSMMQTCELDFSSNNCANSP